MLLKVLLLPQSNSFMFYLLKPLTALECPISLSYVMDGCHPYRTAFCGPASQLRCATSTQKVEA